MLQEGKGRTAVRVALDASLLGLLAALVLLLPMKWLLTDPLRAGELLDEASPWIVAAVIAFLLWGERRKGWRTVGWAVFTLAASGALAMVACAVSLRPLVAVPASSMLPLLSGLFGAAGLVAALSDGALVVPQGPAVRPVARVRKSLRRAVVAGALASGLTLAVAGLTSAAAATLAHAGRKEKEAEPVLATMAAINTTHATLALGLLFVTLRARTGIAASVGTLHPAAAWASGAPPAPLLPILAVALAAGLAGYLVALAIDGPAAAWLPRAPNRALCLAALAFIVGLVALLSGWMGLAILAAATALGLVPVLAGARRIHLTGALLVPALMARL